MMQDWIWCAGDVIVRIRSRGMAETIHHEVRGCLFVWDVDKAAINVKKHKVSFQAACEVFFDPFCLMMQDIGERGHGEVKHCLRSRNLLEMQSPKAV